MALPGGCTTRSGVPPASTAPVTLEGADDERHQVGGHHHGVREGDGDPAVAGVVALDLGGAGDGGEAVLHHQGDPVAGLQPRASSQQGKARRAEVASNWVVAITRSTPRRR